MYGFINALNVAGYTAATPNDDGSQTHTNGHLIFGDPSVTVI